MKSQRGMFKWFGILIIFAIIFEFVQASPLASAQGENTPTPTLVNSQLVFDSIIGLTGEDTFSCVPYHSGLRCEFHVAEWDFSNMTARLNFHRVGTASGVYMGIDAKATGSFAYHDPSIMYPGNYKEWDYFGTYVGDNRSVGTGLWTPYESTFGIYPNGTGYMGFTVHSALGYAAYFDGVVYLMPQPVISTPIPPTETPTPTATPTYDCSGTTLSPIAQAVKDVVGEQAYCGNHYEDGLITLPPGEEAFNQFNLLAQEANYEIDFTTMIWDAYRRDEPELGNSPGIIFLEGLVALSESIQENPENYPPEGVRVRILLGLKRGPFEEESMGLPHHEDQRLRVLDDLETLEVLDNPKLNIEVAVYRDGLAMANHSHAKMMIVDGQEVIAGGYNMQYSYLNESDRRDMGLQVSGPIAAHSLQVFDKLWLGAEQCDQYDTDTCIHQTQIVGPVYHHAAILNPAVTGNDVVFSLYRDGDRAGGGTGDKTADEAIRDAIEAASTNVYIMQDRFMNMSSWVSGEIASYSEAILNTLEKDGSQVNVKLLVTKRSYGSIGETINTRINTTGICNTMEILRREHPSKLQYFEARSSKFPVHTKALSIDNSFVIVGSQNFDWSAFGDNLELADYDLTEYSLAIDSTQETNTAADDFDSHFMAEWDATNSNPIVCYNDSFALQSEIDQAVAGSIIFIPDGVYKESITIDKPLVLVGAGANQTIIQSESNEPVFRVTSSDVTISNMKISGGTGYGIELIDSSPSSLRNIQINGVVFENNAQGGVLVEGQIPGSPMDYTIENNTFIGGADGLTINMLETQADISIVRNNIFSGQSVAPVHILSSDDSRAEYSYNLFDDCGAGNCAANWHVGNISAVSSEHDNLFDLNPLFASPENGAYQLSAGSPAIDAGDPSLLHDLFYDGDNDGTIQIDIGAFEYVPVTNAAPVVNAGNDQNVDLGNSVAINTTYTDIDNPENHSARIDWGDGTVEDVPVTMTGPGAGEVAGEHSYATPGNYTVEICVTDLYGGVGCDTITVEVTSLPTACTPSNAYGASPNGGAKFASFTTLNTMNFSCLPLSFVPNAGQEDQVVRFQAQGSGGNLFFASNEVVFSLPNPEKVKESDQEKIRYDLHPANVVRIHYQGANEHPEVVALGELPGTVNILTGTDASKWQTNLPTYSGIVYRDLYPGIDLHYEGEDGKLKSTFHVSPGADPAAIVWRYKGASDVNIDESGNLVISLPEPAGTGALLVEEAPIAWQEVGGTRVMVTVQYVLDKKDKKVSFMLPNGYDPTLPLVIDPTMSYSTYLGGGGIDNGKTITLDADCNIYLTGITYSTSFPTQTPIQTNQPGGDVFVTKLDSTGTTLIYSTYLGGSGSDYGRGIALDSQGRITIVGETDSSDFPMMHAFDPSFAGGTCDGNEQPCDDVFVTQLFADGSALRYSTYLGGEADDEGYGMAVGPDDMIYLTGWTTSSTFPTTDNAYDRSFGGGTCSGSPCKDGFVAKVNPALTGISSLLYSTFLGGDNYDLAQSIALDDSGHVYVTGYARSSTYPTRNAYQATRAGNCDIFVTKLDTTLTGDASLLYSTFFGGSGSDYARGIALNGADQVYLTGRTQSTNFPLTNAFDNSFGGGTCGSSSCDDAFVTYLDIANNIRVYSSYLGGGHEDNGEGITVDENGNAYLTGHTKSTDFPTLEAIQDNKATDSCSSSPCADAFVIKLSPAGTLVYSTYLGGAAEDYGNAIVHDGLGSVYIVGYTYSSNFPITPDAFQNIADDDLFLVRIED